MVYAVGVLLIAVIGLFLFSRIDNRKLGKEEGQHEEMNNMLNEVRRAKIVRDALNNDPTFADKLRSKYTRR